MSDRNSKHLRRSRWGFTQVALVAAVLVVSSAGSAIADTGADAKILNVTTVNYKDASGTVSFTATASATVTVSLVPAPVTISGRPTGANPGDTAAQPAGATVASGDTATYLYALTANANGDENYTLSTLQDGANFVSGDSVSSALVGPDGTTLLVAGPSAVVLGASVVTAVPTPALLEFPAGSLTGIAVGDIVIIDGVDYAVATVSNGTVASHTNGSGPNATSGTTTPETPASMTLASNFDGSSTFPIFTPGPGSPLIGQVVGEQALLRVQVTATANDPVNDGTVDFDVVLEPSSTPGLNTADVQNLQTTFSSVGLTITKQVRNVTQAGAFGANATGDPGDVLEYRLTISNSGGTATEVVVTDPVPPYTQLVLFSDTYGGTETVTFGPAVFFASSNLGATTVDITADNTDTENAAVTSGNAPGSGAGSILTLYVGAGNTSSTGGSITSADTVTILFRVRIE